MNLSEVVMTATEAAELAGAVMREQRHNASFEIKYKGTRDLVTTADLACEK